MSNKHNPWLADYTVPDLESVEPADRRSLPSELHRDLSQPSSTQYSQGRFVESVHDSDSSESSDSASSPAEASPVMRNLLLAGSLIFVSILSGLAASVAGSIYQDWHRANQISHPPSSLEKVNYPAISIQIHPEENRARALEYLKSKKREALIHPSDFLNDSKNFHIIGDIENIPFFVLEPRPGYEDQFNHLLKEDLYSYRLFAFEYSTEEALFQVAVECGLPIQSGVQWIKQWSTWRDSSGRQSISECRDGGWCLLISYRGCSSRAYSSWEVRR